jgi:parallel beta-helix repeat protein
MYKKKTLSRVLICLLMLFVVFCSVAASSYSNIDVEKAQEMLLENPEKCILLDVRTVSEYNSGYIPSALNIPVSELDDRLDELDSSKSIIAYCKVGYRSRTASDQLVKHGFEHVYNMLGGTDAWKKKYALSNSASTPKVITIEATDIDATSVALNGSLDATGGLLCHVWFEYGTTTLYGSSTPKEFKISPGPFTAGIVSLDDNTPYHFRAVASNIKGTVYGSDGFIQTPPLPAPPLPVHNLNTREDFATIQAAIKAFNTTNRHTIIVDPGTYTENVDVYKQLTIQSRSGNYTDTIVQAASTSDHVFAVTADHVTIRGFSVTSATGEDIAGISVNSSDTLLMNNIIANNTNGIYLAFSNNNTINHNVIDSNSNGIRLHHSGTIIIANNTVTNNTNGLRLHDTGNCTLTTNTINSNENGIQVHSSCDGRLINNTVQSNNNGIQLHHSDNGRIAHNTVKSNNKGIRLYFSSTNLVYNNYFNNTENAWDNGNNIWNLTKTAGTNIIGGLYLGGNYWSDYTGEDVDGDGLGNTEIPYNASGSIQYGGDYLPLTVVATTSDAFDRLEGRYMLEGKWRLR